MVVHIFPHCRSAQRILLRYTILIATTCIIRPDALYKIRPIINPRPCVLDHEFLVKHRTCLQTYPSFYPAALAAVCARGVLRISGPRQKCAYSVGRCVLLRGTSDHNETSDPGSCEHHSILFRNLSRGKS
jgi:hypothetical protein